MFSWKNQTSLTTQSHLTTSGQHSFQHFTDFNVTKHAPDRAAHAVMDYSHDLQQHYFVARRIARLKFTMRNGCTEFHECML